MTKFKYTAQQEIYELYFRNPPTKSVGGGLTAAYWRGRNESFSVLQNSTYDRGSLAYAAWRAGRKHQIMGNY